MADNTVALNVKVPDSLNTLGSIMGIANQVQDYKRGRVALEKETALLQPGIEKGEAESATAVTGAETARYRLTGEQASAAMRVIGGLQNDPRIVNSDPDGTVHALIEARDQMIASGVPKAQAEWQISQPMSKAHTPGAVRQLLINKINQNQSPQAQANVVNAPLTPVGTGGAVTPMQLQPGAAPAQGVPAPGASVPITLGPDQRQQVGTNPVTQSPQTISKDAQGNVIGVQPTPTGAGVPQLRPGEPQEIPLRTQQRMAVNQAAAAVPEQHFNNRQIIELAPKAFTGAGSQSLSRIFSAYGIQQIPGDDATNFQRLGHFMARQVQSNAAAMGAGTDQAREIAANATGTTNWTKDAIISTAKVNDAFASGLEHFNRGMEAAIKANGGNVLAVRDFQNSWSSNFDPRVMQINNAAKAGDKKEIDEILKQVGGKNSPGARDLIQKARNIESLTETGRL